MREARLAALAALLALTVAACGDVDEWPAAGSGPSAYSGSTTGSAFDPRSRATSGSAAAGTATSPSAAQTGAAGNGTGTTGTAGINGQTTGTQSGGTGTTQQGFVCGGLICPANSFCLVQTNISPTIAPAPECRIIPAGCTTCDCVKPFADCLCSPIVGGGGLMISCP